MNYCEEMSYENVKNEVCALKREGKVEFFSIGRSLRGREIFCLTLGDGAECGIFVGVHHGMERITAALILKFVRDIAEGNVWGGRTADVLASRRIYFIPMLNPDGAEIALGNISEKEKAELSRLRGGKELRFWQANARGVDLNHNYDAGYYICRGDERRAGIFTAGSTRYGGAHAESEPETRALCDFTREISEKLAYTVALHTQGEEIYCGYDGKIPQGAEEMARAAAEKCGYVLAEPEAIASHGGYKDWVTDKFDIPSFTFECGLGKNPLPPTDFPAIYEKLSPVFADIVTFRKKRLQ